MGVTDDYKSKKVIFFLFVIFFSFGAEEKIVRDGVGEILSLM
jgi:hypothetical protein